MDEHSIGKTIAELRKAKTWTQVELAEKLHVTDKAVSKWESGAGLPEISQFPSLAALFDVSIDFLMTGKTPEKEILTMSKAELCARNDDTSMAKAVISLPKDENGKDITDYIIQYESLNVFKKLCELDHRFITRFDIIDAISLCIISNSLFNLRDTSFRTNYGIGYKFKNAKDLLSLQPKEEAYNFPNHVDTSTCILPRSFFTMLVTDKRINDDTWKILLYKENGRESVWFRAIPYMIEEAYKANNKTLLNRLLEVSINNNKKAYNPKISYWGYRFNYFFLYNTHAFDKNDGFGLVRILESTIKLALEKGDFTFIKQFNEINKKINEFTDTTFKTANACYVADEDAIRISKLKLDKSIKQSDFIVQSAIHKGIISIKELLLVKDPAVIKEALRQYPIHPFELLYKLHKAENYRELYRMSIDYQSCSFADAIISDNKSAFLYNLLLLWWNNGLKDLNINANILHCCPIRSTSKPKIQEKQELSYYENKVAEILAQLDKEKQNIIQNASHEQEKLNRIQNLTKEYFYSELENGNTELVVIKLCVRLEAILKYDNGYEGDFSDMLDCFCKTFNVSDDEANSYDPYTPVLLNKLRKYRNDIVHSEKNSTPLTKSEIEECIKYICAL